MTSFELGTYVKYSNKREKTDIAGTITAKVSDYYIIEIDSGTGRYAGVQSYYPSEHSKALLDHFSPKNPQHTAWGYNTKKSSYWVNRRSRNLRLGELQYDPNQQGDTDEDI